MSQHYSFLYLASQSPRRQELLTQIGAKFELLLPDDFEDAELLESLVDGESSIKYVERVTIAKLSAAVKRLQNRKLKWSPILCADTTVAITIDGHEHILGKPKDIQDAHNILSMLSGKTHQVHTAVALQEEDSDPPILIISSSNVSFSELSKSQIDAYLTSQEYLGKAGAYGIQGLAACFIKHIEGSFSGIMGLPIFETAQLLENCVEYKLNRF
jgi:septum formation protein